jgi:hypothetical protein
VFADLASQIPAGIKVGIDKGAPEAKAAAANVVAPKLSMPAAPAAAPGAAKAAGRGATSITIQSLTVQAPAGADPQKFALSLRRELETVLAGLAVEIGAPA